MLGKEMRAGGDELPEHEAHMRRAIELAKKGLGRTSPNPAVGAVLVRDGRVIAAGFHAAPGTDHAEVAALRQVGFEARGSTLYTTLEPCAHTGRTGPCTEAILRAGVAEVVVGTRDPNPIVDGRGIRLLEQAGVRVSAMNGGIERECRDLNEAYNFVIRHRRPFVVLKAAVSLDGHPATRGGESRWITSEEARAEGRAMRDRLDAILVGIGTVLADDPELTARVPGGRDPVRIVLDSGLRIPLRSRIVQTAKEVRTLVATTRRADAAKRARLEAAGVEVQVLKSARDGKVDLAKLMELLTAKQANSLLVEGGRTVHGAFVDRRLVNKVVIFAAPLVFGGAGAPAWIAGRGARKLGEALRLGRMSAEMIGPDLVITAYVEE